MDNPRFRFFYTFLNKKKLYKNSRKILNVFRKTVEDGLNPPLKPANPSSPERMGVKTATEKERETEFN